MEADSDSEAEVESWPTDPLKRPQYGPPGPPKSKVSKIVARIAVDLRIKGYHSEYFSPKSLSGPLMATTVRSLVPTRWVWPDLAQNPGSAWSKFLPGSLVALYSLV